MSRTIAFAISGTVWVGSLLVSDPHTIHYPMPNVISLASVYVLIATGLIAWLRDKFTFTLLGLWVLAMVFFAILLREPQEDWATLFLAGAYFGTIAFLMWCSFAFLILRAWKFLQSHFGKG